MILLPFYSHSTDDSTPILLMILLPFRWWFYSHSASILLMILLPFYSHSTNNSTPILLMILLPFCLHSTDDSTPILLAFYWWFYSHSTRIILMILLPFCAWGLGVCPHSTDHYLLFTSHLLACYWWFYFYSTEANIHPYMASAGLVRVQKPKKGAQQSVETPRWKYVQNLRTSSSSMTHEQNRGYIRRHGHTKRGGGGGV